MRSLTLLLATPLAFLAFAAAGSAQPKTTSPGEYMTVHVIVTDKGITMSPTHARRGTTAIFLVSNRSKSERVFSLGDVTLARQKGTGFAIKLAHDERKRVQVYLTYRGPLPSALGDTGKTKVVGVFNVT